MAFVDHPVESQELHTPPLEEVAQGNNAHNTML